MWVIVWVIVYERIIVYVWVIVYLCGLLRMVSECPIRPLRSAYAQIANGERRRVGELAGHGQLPQIKRTARHTIGQCVQGRWFAVARDVCECGGTA